MFYCVPTGQLLVHSAPCCPFSFRMFLYSFVSFSLHYVNGINKSDDDDDMACEYLVVVQKQLFIRNAQLRFPCSLYNFLRLRCRLSVVYRRALQKFGTAPQSPTHPRQIWSESSQSRFG